MPSIGTVHASSFAGRSSSQPAGQAGRRRL